MARDEMHTITADVWDDEIWGAQAPSSHPHPRPVLRFLFAREDHWVADETRDELIRARGGDGGEAWRPVMEVDAQGGYVHGFCIEQSIPVAEKVGGWVREMMERDGGR